MEIFYSNKVMRILEQKGIKLFDKVLITWNGTSIRGILLPRPQYGDPNVLVIKLENGYNIGIDIDKIKDIKLLERSKPIRIAPLPPSKINPNLPKVAILGTGGTIASRVDYSTGAVYPSFTAEDVYALVPELANIARLELKTIFNIFSEDMTPKNWERIAEEIAKKFEDKEIKGVVIAHGTDTMGYTAAALSFALRKIPGPVALVGAQRSSDRPSSDTALNLISAVTLAIKAPFAEVVVVMHGETSDSFALAHRGTKVRKCHTSRRDAFRSINSKPLALIKNGEVKLLVNDYKPRSKPGEVILENGFDDKVALIKFYPGMSPEIIDFLIDRGYHGIVIEATGLGHVRKELVKPIQRAIEEGIPVAITSQCLWGRVNLNVYRRGVELLKAGVIPCEDMLPETAFVKLSWILYRTRDLKEVRRMMLTNYAYEINHRSEYGFYPPVLEVKV